ncbi:MAG: MerR family transcriptional regulator [Variibacter sp.]|nr:MerR family transcriptional regulator [Variibacter sp.]
MDKAPDAFRTISEVADELDVPQHVLRFWETRFPQIKPMKRGGGRRYYRPDDVDLLRGIRHLLYGEGYTIRGVQRLLKDNGAKFVQGIWRGEGTKDGERGPMPAEPDAGTEARAAAEDAAEEDAGDLPQAAGPAVAEGVRELPSSALPSLPAREPQGRTFSRANVAPEPPAARPPEAALVAAPAAAPEPAAVPAQPAAVAELSAENRQRLQASLYELGECRRLLEAALKDE